VCCHLLRIGSGNGSQMRHSWIRITFSDLSLVSRGNLYAILFLPLARFKSRSRGTNRQVLIVNNYVVKSGMLANTHQSRGWKWYTCILKTGSCTTQCAYCWLLFSCHRLLVLLRWRNGIMVCHVHTRVVLRREQFHALGNVVWHVWWYFIWYFELPAHEVPNGTNFEC
jgi:hypothetical protein